MDWLLCCRLAGFGVRGPVGILGLNIGFGRPKGLGLTGLGSLRATLGASVSANKSYNVFLNEIKTRNIQNLNLIRLLISSPGGFMDFGLFFNGAAATFD